MCLESNSVGGSAMLDQLFKTCSLAYITHNAI